MLIVKKVLCNKLILFLYILICLVVVRSIGNEWYFLPTYCFFIFFFKGTYNKYLCFFFFCSSRPHFLCKMDILISSFTKLSSLPTSSVIGVTAAIGFVNYYFLYAVRVSILIDSNKLHLYHINCNKYLLLRSQTY